MKCKIYWTDMYKGRLHTSTGDMNMNIRVQTIKTPKEKVKRQHTICIGHGPLTVQDFRMSIVLNMDQKTFEDLIKNTNSIKEDRLAFSNREKAESALLILTMLLNG